MPATSSTEESITKIRQIVRENLRLTVRSIAEHVNINRDTVRKILTEDLDLRKVCAKMVPKELTEEQKQRRVTIFEDLLERQDDILGCIITGDETVAYQYDSETKQQIAQWMTQFRTTKKNPPVQIRSQNNGTELFDIRGIALYKFVPTGQPVNHAYYLEVLERLRERDGNDPNFFAKN